MAHALGTAYALEARGMIELKGKGETETFFLLGPGA